MVTVERGNLPNGERCGGSRLMVGDNTYTIVPPPIYGDFYIEVAVLCTERQADSSSLC